MYFNLTKKSTHRLCYNFFNNLVVAYFFGPAFRTISEHWGMLTAGKVIKSIHFITRLNLGCMC